jgi:hypothetical protein
MRGRMWRALSLRRRKRRWVGEGEHRAGKGRKSLKLHWHGATAEEPRESPAVQLSVLSASSTSMQQQQQG